MVFQKTGVLLTTFLKKPIKQAFFNFFAYYISLFAYYIFPFTYYILAFTYYILPYFPNLLTTFLAQSRI